MPLTPDQTCFFIELARPTAPPSPMFLVLIKDGKNTKITFVDELRPPATGTLTPTCTAELAEYLLKKEATNG